VSNFFPSAIITAVDKPLKYWYEALTTFGATVTGVRLKGTWAKFNVGQKVAVFDCNNVFGFSEYASYASQLNVPGGIKPAIAAQAPATVALAYIANLANNNKVIYKPSVIEAISEAKVKANGMLLPCAVPAQAFTVGDGCLIQIGKPSRVLGWWQCVPAGDPELGSWEWVEATDTEPGYWRWVNASGGLQAISIGRVPFSARCEMQQGGWSDIGEYVVSKTVAFYPDDLRCNFAFCDTYPSRDTDEYFYSHIQAGINFGMVLETHYVRWHKHNFTVEEMNVNEWQAQVELAPAQTITVDGKIWWWEANQCWVSEAGGEPIAVFFTGATSEQWFPVQGQIYPKPAEEPTP